MASDADQLRRLDALVAVGLRLARSAPSGRVLLAQLAARLDPVWIPQPWGAEILAALEAAAQDAREPIPFKRIEQTLRGAWGSRPTDELDDLDPEPVAVTPGAQVHRGTLDGTPVAVKVQRPGLARGVGQDLALLDALAAPLSAAFPAIDAGGILREVAERTRDELDLEHVAGVQRQLHRPLRRHPALGVPAPHTGLAAAEVLVTDWVDGIPISELADPAPAAAGLVRLVLGGGAEVGLMVSGLTPEDVVVDADGRVHVVDVGVTAPVRRPRLVGAADALEGLLDDDVDRFATAVAGLDWLPADRAPEALALVCGVLGPLVGGEVRLDAAAVVEAGRRVGERSGEALELIRSGRLEPVDVWPARAAAELFGVLARVGVDCDPAGLALAALRDGWS